MSSFSRLLFVIGVSIAAAVNPAAADFSEGLEAYDAGRYQEALTAWRAAAAHGHLDAMVAIAGLYEAGSGVHRDLGLAAAWYRRAADCGHAVAQMNLGELYDRGLGVPRDAVAAYVYFARAASQGRAWAEDRRKVVALGLTEADRARAATRLSVERPVCRAGAD